LRKRVRFVLSTEYPGIRGAAGAGAKSRGLNVAKMQATVGFSLDTGL
jgi:hypothetical protein